MVARILPVLLLPAVAFAQSASGGGVLYHVPLIGGPRVFAYVHGRDYPPGQEVDLEVYATSDLPAAREVFLGRAKKVVGAGGQFDLGIISDRLPDTRFEWKIKYWFTPRARTGEVNAPGEFTARRNPPARE